MRRAWESNAPMMLGGIAGSIAFVVSPSHAPREFFSIAAQIIVVLVIATVLQSRLLSVRTLELPMPRRRSLTMVGPARENPKAARRARARRRLNVWWRINYVFGATYSLLAGELYALVVLMDARRHSADPRLVMMGIAWSMVALTTAGILAENADQSKARDDRTDEDPPASIAARR